MLTDNQRAYLTVKNLALDIALIIIKAKKKWLDFSLNLQLIMRSGLRYFSVAKVSDICCSIQRSTVCGKTIDQFTVRCFLLSTYGLRDKTDGVLSLLATERDHLVVY